MDLYVNADDTALAALTNVRANDNGEDGIYGSLSAGTTHGWLSETAIDDLVTDRGHWHGFLGLHAKFDVTGGPIVAEDNSLDDIDVW